MKTLILSMAALLMAGSAMADSASHAPVIHDKAGYFVHLDVDKVLSSTHLSWQCGVVPARLDYLDSSGNEHVLDYQVYGYGCTNDN
jgi:hypothetical protein